MNVDYSWFRQFQLDVDYGFVSAGTSNAPLHNNPRIVLNEDGSSVLRAIRSELRRSTGFVFSVAFVTPAAIAMLKQDLLEFGGTGLIVTSDYLGFNSPQAFAELLKLRDLGIDARLHQSKGFHPKGYIFNHEHSVTAMMGSSNLTPSALVRNHEWNLKVSAAPDSDLASQLTHLAERQVAESVPMTAAWIDLYASTYTRPPERATTVPRDPAKLISATEARDLNTSTDEAPSQEASSRAALSDNVQVPSLAPPPAPSPETAPLATTRLPDEVVSDFTPVTDALPVVAASQSAIVPNAMQHDALQALSEVRNSREKRAIIVSATGTGKTLLSALDVRSVNPRRMLFLAHREQILDRTIEEYQWVLGGPQTDYGKLTGTSKDVNARYLFATVQTLSQPGMLSRFASDVFDYVIIDEAHRTGASTHRRIIDHFDPVFMLGMTATPERTDGFNVFEQFHYNVPYEIRLNHALEEGMLSPFHYYGITDATFDDNTTIGAESDLNRLISPERVQHLIWALDTYSQARVAPRGLIFCSRKQEARLLSDALNTQELRGRRLRTAALTGDDSIEHREWAVQQLEASNLDYILTVDVFNEGVDIPSLNQVIMLRQTQSAIIFVQQLGRGLRKFRQKDYLVVIDFIGNYANNFLIPIALFGDDSLNKESLRKNLTAAEEAGFLPGLSSVHFDNIAQERVLASIRDTRLDDMSRLKAAIVAMRNRVGGVPRLWDFLRFESVDPVLLATKREHYPALIRTVLKEDIDLTPASSRALQLLSHEVFPAKRGHEFVLLRELLSDTSVTTTRLQDALDRAGLPSDRPYIDSTINTFTLEGFAEADRKRYQGGLAERVGNTVVLKTHVAATYGASKEFAREVDDLRETGSEIAKRYYPGSERFTPGRQYSRKEALRLLCWPRSWASTVYGYKVDRATGACPIFVTLHKSDEISVSTAYEDRLLDPSSMLWYTRSRRTLQSAEVRSIVNNDVDLFVFVKKDDAEGTDSYFLGQATAHDAEETTMAGANGERLSVVRMILRFQIPIETALYDYFHPVVTE